MRGTINRRSLVEVLVAQILVCLLLTQRISEAQEDVRIIVDTLDEFEDIGRTTCSKIESFDRLCKSIPDNPGSMGFLSSCTVFECTLTINIFSIGGFGKVPYQVEFDAFVKGSSQIQARYRLTAGDSTEVLGSARETAGWETTIVNPPLEVSWTSESEFVFILESLTPEVNVDYLDKITFVFNSVSTTTDVSSSSTSIDPITFTTDISSTSTTADPSSSTTDTSSPSTIDDSSPSTTDDSSPSTTDDSSPSTIDDSSPSTIDDSSPSTIDDSSPSTTDDSSPSTIDDSSPSTIDDSSPSTMDDSSPSTIDDSSPSTIDDSSPSTIDDSSPSTIDDSSPSTIDDSSPSTIDDSSPSTIDDSSPSTIDDSSPSTIDDSSPSTIDDSSPSTIDDSSPSTTDSSSTSTSDISSSSTSDISSSSTDGESTSTVDGPGSSDSSGPSSTLATSSTNTDSTTTPASTVISYPTTSDSSTPPSIPSSAKPTPESTTVTTTDTTTVSTTEDPLFSDEVIDNNNDRVGWNNTCDYAETHDRFDDCPQMNIPVHPGNRRGFWSSCGRLCEMTYAGSKDPNSRIFKSPPTSIIINSFITGTARLEVWVRVEGMLRFVETLMDTTWDIPRQIFLTNLGFEVDENSEIILEPYSTRYPNHVDLIDKITFRYKDLPTMGPTTGKPSTIPTEEPSPPTKEPSLPTENPSIPTVSPSVPTAQPTTPKPDFSGEDEGDNLALILILVGVGLLIFLTVIFLGIGIYLARKKSREELIRSRSNSTSFDDGQPDLRELSLEEGDQPIQNRFQRPIEKPYLFPRLKRVE